MSKSSVSLIVIFTSILLSAGIIYYPSTQTITVTTARVKRGTFVQKKELVGVVGYTHESAVYIPSAGKITDVYASNHQMVRAGELLFRLDAAEEEKALEELNSIDFLFLSAMNIFRSEDNLSGAYYLNAQQRKLQLLKQIETSQIRSEIDGIFESNGIRKGQYVVAGIAGRIRSSRKCVWIHDAQGETVKQGTKVDLFDGKNRIGQAVCQGETSKWNGQQCTLLLQYISENDCLDQYEEGKSIIVEWSEEEYPNNTLIPLAAVSKERQVWIVEKERAFPYTIEIGECNEYYMSGPDELSEKTLILLPDLYELTPGCLVKEKED